MQRIPLLPGLVGMLAAIALQLLPVVGVLSFNVLPGLGVLVGASAAAISPYMTPAIWQRVVG